MAGRAVTWLVVELDRRSDDGLEAEQVLDIVCAHGGTACDGEDDGPAVRLWSTFTTSYDATRAAVRVSAAARMPGTAVSATPPRMALCQADTGTGRPLPVRAERLLGQAGPGQVVLTGDTAILAGPVLPVGAALVHVGRLVGPEPQRIYELRSGAGDGTTDLGWARQAVEGATAVGDLSAVTAAWERAAGGAARCVLVTGRAVERGAVVAELALRLDALGARVLHGRWEARHPAPFPAFGEALGRYADHCPTDVLRADLADHADGLSRVLPEVAARAGTRPDTAVPEQAATGALLGWLRAITGRHPIVLVLEDADRMDPPSLSLLADVWHACRQRPLMLVLSLDDPAADLAGRLRELLGEQDGDEVLTRIRV